MMVAIPTINDVLVVLTLLICMIQMVSASLKLPSGLNQEQYCAGCEAITKELHIQLKKRSAESIEVRVQEALEAICDQKFYKTYDMPPGKIVRACKYLLGEYDEDMEQILISHIRLNDSQKALEKRFCHMLSKACLGLRDTKKVDPRETDEYKNFNLEIPEDAKYVRPVADQKDEL